MLQQAAKKQIDQAWPQDAIGVAERADDQVSDKTEPAVAHIFVTSAGPECVDFRQATPVVQFRGRELQSDRGVRKNRFDGFEILPQGRFPQPIIRAGEALPVFERDMVRHCREVAEHSEAAPELPILSKLELRIESLNRARSVLMQMAPQTMKFLAIRCRKVSPAGNNFQRRSDVVESAEPSSAILI
ncbi:MAG: hypothetical protein WB677_11405 [Xanthobacteraceae bacterium]